MLQLSCCSWYCGCSQRSCAVIVVSIVVAKISVVVVVVVAVVAVVAVVVVVVVDATVILLLCLLRSSRSFCYSVVTVPQPLIRFLVIYIVFLKVLN